MRPLRGLLHDPKIQVILRLVVFRMGLLSGLVTKKAFLEGTVGTIRGIEWFLRAFASSASSDQFSHASSEHFVNFPPAGISLY